MFAVRPLVALSAAALCAAAFAADPPAPPPPPAAEIAEAVRQLGASRYAAREKAQQTLWRAGPAAEPALRAALTNTDAEVVRRARAVLDKFDWGLYPDTPAPVAAQIGKFRDGDDEAKGQAVAELVRLGGPGYAALAKLATRADTPESRQLLGDAITHAARKAVPLMLLERNYDAAAAILDAALIGGSEDAVANYVALALIRDKLPEAIRRWEAAKGGKSERAGEVLAALYRAKGDFAAALKHAAGNDDLTYVLLWEQGDWKALAARPEPDQRPVVAAAAKAAYLRLAGDPKAADAELARLRKPTGPDEEWVCVKGLLLNERPADALERLRAAGKQRAAQFDVLAAQLRYKDALALADAGDGEDDPPGGMLLRQARTLYLLGEKDRAGQLFNQVAGGLKAPGDAFAAATLVQTETRLGLADAARDHAAGYLGTLARLAVDERTDPAGRVLEAAFPKHGPDAKAWWQFLRQKFPKDDAMATMKRVRDLLAPPAGAKSAGPGELADALTEALRDSQDDNARAAVRLALAAAYEAAGQFDAARDQLAKAAELKAADVMDPGLKLGDLLFRRGQFTEAAAAYGALWKRDQTQPLPLALQGWALLKAGQAKEGQALLEQAHALPLGDVNARAMLAEELTKRDAAEPARREWDLIRKLGWARSWSVANFLAALGRDAAARKDYATAADAYERVVLGVLSNDVNFVEGSAYLSVPAVARAYRARAALAAGQVEDALAHARACLDLTPGNIDVALLLVPELDRRGRKADADALYGKVAGAYAGMAKDFPHSGFAHNAVAWLAACCHRDLDAALDHARKAVELEPKQAGHRDTLAEVHFQRGETAKAVELMRECIALDPHKAYYGKQLARFQAGDRAVPPPEEDD
ncbi:MAG TPA: hypothetical protein VGF55_23080 [Gemmataceae bacterium]